MDKAVLEIKEVVGQAKEVLSSLAYSKEKNQERENITMKFLLDNLDKLLMEVDNLDKAISLGMPISEYSENISKLSRIEVELKKQEEKFEVLTETLSEIRKKQKELEEVIQQGISERRLALLESRMKNLEAVQEKLQKSKSTKIVIELVNALDMLNRRIKTLEELVKFSGEKLITHGTFSQKNFEMKDITAKEKKRKFLREVFDFFKSIRR